MQIQYARKRFSFLHKRRWSILAKQKVLVRDFTPLCGPYSRSEATLQLIRSDIKAFDDKPQPPPKDPTLDEAIRRSSGAAKNTTS